MGMIQDFLKKLREGNQPATIEELHDERTKDRQLLLLRKEYREMREQQEKVVLKERLRHEYKKKMSKDFFGFKTDPDDKVKIIRALQKKKKNTKKEGYLCKYNLK